MINKLNQLIGKSTVLEMDNKLMQLGASEYDSILNGDNIYYAFENESHAYTIDGTDYNICFKYDEEAEFEQKEDVEIEITKIEIL